MEAETEPTDLSPEGRGAFGGFVGPRTLRGLVVTAAPYLFDGTDLRALEVPAPSGARPSDGLDQRFGWWTVLNDVERLPATATPSAAERTDYFALCLGAHFASAGTYVPTDVDAKIRHALWFEDVPSDELARMADLALGLAHWDVAPVSARLVHVEDFGVVSGHDGERLSVLVGGLLAHLAAGDTATAERLDEAVAAELDREARAFDALARRHGRERELILLATTLTHNAGDVAQALDGRSGRAVAAGPRERFGDLARSGATRFGGAFQRAAAIYREIGAAEGHRHYPLRDVKALRTSAGLLLPLGPFLDDWGACVATWPTFDNSVRAAVVTALVAGCKRVPGQEGYYRALAGFEQAHGNGFDDARLAGEFNNATRRGLADSNMRKKLAVRRASFESSLAKRARALVGG